MRDKNTRDKGMGKENMRMRTCSFCAGKIDTVDYKDVDLLKKFTTDKGKIFPRRMSACCSKHQRLIAKAVKRSRHAALMPFVAEQ